MRVSLILSNKPGLKAAARDGSVLIEGKTVIDFINFEIDVLKQMPDVPMAQVSNTQKIKQLESILAQITQEDPVETASDISDALPFLGDDLAGVIAEQLPNVEGKEAREQRKASEAYYNSTKYLEQEALKKKAELDLAAAFRSEGKSQSDEATQPISQAELESFFPEYKDLHSKSTIERIVQNPDSIISEILFDLQSNGQSDMQRLAKNLELVCRFLKKTGKTDPEILHLIESKQLKSIFEHDFNNLLVKAGLKKLEIRADFLDVADSEGLLEKYAAMNSIVRIMEASGVIEQSDDSTQIKAALDALFSIDDNPNIYSRILPDALKILRAGPHQDIADKLEATLRLLS